MLPAFLGTAFAKLRVSRCCLPNITALHCACAAAPRLIASISLKHVFFSRCRVSSTCFTSVQFVSLKSKQTELNWVSTTLALPTT